MSSIDPLGVSISAAGPAFAAIFTNPADVAKTRLNMDRELESSRPPRYRGMVHCVRSVWSSEGAAGVQRGLSFSMFREASKCSFRIGLHEPIVNAIHQGPGPAPFAIKALGGLCSGGLSALICNPLDLIKTRLQLDAGHACGSATTMSAPGLLAQVIREEGVSSLWRGTQVSMARSMAGNAGLLGVNMQLKEVAAKHMQPGTLPDALCALAAGAACVAAINPMDVVRTRLYSQPTDASGVGTLYKSAFDCASKILTIEGAPAFYKGASANFVRVGPHTILTFVFIGWMRRAAEK